MGREQGRHRRRPHEVSDGHRWPSPVLGRLGAGLLALLIAATTSSASGATAPPAAPPSGPAVSEADLRPDPDLARLQADLDTARQQVSDATAAATEAAGRVVGAQITLAAARVDVDRARAGLRDQVRQTLVDGPLTRLPAWVFSSDPSGGDLLGELRSRSVARQVDQVGRLRDALARLDGATRSLTAQRDEAARKAGAAVLAADRARRLLDDGMRIAQTNQTIRTQLAERKRALDAWNAALVAALAKVQTRTEPPQTNGSLPQAVDTLPDGSKPDASASAQAAVLQVLEATLPGQLPAGYRPSGQVFQGESSWYGPGFVGSPTSTGVPYDPEKLTCAMLAVPLGTVVRVTTPAGRSVTLLVNDHGPYVGDRIIDVSMRANRILELGLGQVRIEVLERVR